MADPSNSLSDNGEYACIHILVLVPLHYKYQIQIKNIWIDFCDGLTRFS